LQPTYLNFKHYKYQRFLLNLSPFFLINFSELNLDNFKKNIAEAPQPNRIYESTKNATCSYTFTYTCTGSDLNSWRKKCFRNRRKNMEKSTMRWRCVALYQSMSQHAHKSSSSFFLNWKDFIISLLTNNTSILILKSGS